MDEEDVNLCLINLFLLLHLFGLLSSLFHLLFKLSLIYRGYSVYKEASDNNIPELIKIFFTYSLYQGFFFSFSFGSFDSFELPAPEVAEDAELVGYGISSKFGSFS